MRIQKILTNQMLRTYIERKYLHCYQTHLKINIIKILSQRESGTQARKKLNNHRFILTTTRK